MIRVSTIKSVVADYHEVPVESLSRRFRYRTETHARHMAMFLCRELTEKSWRDIGEHFNRNHTSVYYGVCLVKRKMKKNMKVQFEYDELRAKILDGTQDS